MTYGLISSSLYDRLDVSEGPIHQVLSLKAGDRTRLFCNYLWCTYDEILDSPDQEEIDLATTEHELLNEL